ncbi:MAG: hypothetical protein IKN49_06160 [Elusimicrobiaceae bacterium]|nr:hypothetical protein [Elusimicrobiaceae bacterium]
MTNPNSKNNLTVLLVLLLVVILGGALLIHKITATHSEPEPTAQQEIPVSQPFSTESVPNPSETSENQTPENVSASADQPLPPLMQTMIDMQKKADQQQSATEAPLHQSNLSFDQNARGSKVTSMRTTRSSAACHIFPTHTNYLHPVCTLYTYEDHSSSVVLFSQNVLRERMDFKDMNDKTPIQKITLYKNGQIDTLEFYPSPTESKLFTFTSDGLFSSKTIRSNNQTTEMIAFSTLKTDPKMPMIQYAFSIGENKVQTYSLKKSEFPNFIYQKQILTPSEKQDLGLVSGKMDEQGQVILSDQMILPARSHWKNAPDYCALYPHDCITQ